MPELPEVETIRAGLVPHVVGHAITAARVLHPRAVRRHPVGATDLTDRLAGRVVHAAVRRGKYLWLTLDGDEALVIHLGMSGQLLVHHEAPPPDPHLRVSLSFDDGSELSFVDQRTFGHLLLAELEPTADGHPGGQGSPAATVPDVVAHIARDPIDPYLDDALLSRRLRAKRTEVKRALLDQSLVSGIGNIYADEALWRAGLHPRRPTAALRAPAVVGLLAEVRAVLNEALAAGGTSFDALYVDVTGTGGYFSRELAAYGRSGQPCHRCGRLMTRESFTNRSSTFCPGCQRAPRAPRAQPPRAQPPRAQRA